MMLTTSEGRAIGTKYADLLTAALVFSNIRGNRRYGLAFYRLEPAGKGIAFTGLCGSGL